MKQEIVERFARKQRALESGLLQEALNGFGMNRHYTPRFSAELTGRIRVAHRWGLVVGTVLGVVGVTLLTLLAWVVIYLAGVM